MTTERELIRELRDALSVSYDHEFNSRNFAEQIAKADAYLATPEVDARCPHIATSREGTSYCRLAESDARDAARYRCLREQPVSEPYGTPRIAIPSNSISGEFVNGNDADDLIDAAMKETT